MRPDRVVVGEVRGPEASVALDAMSTGHPGSLVTVHASSARGAIERMVALGCSAGRTPESSVRTAVTSAFDLVVFVERDRGARRVSEILSVA
jgi:pilus assembly protein CpaF